jgi:hypothetical protein
MLCLDESLPIYTVQVRSETRTVSIIEYKLFGGLIYARIEI